MSIADFPSHFLAWWWLINPLQTACHKTSTYLVFLPIFKATEAWYFWGVNLELFCQHVTLLWAVHLPSQGSGQCERMNQTIGETVQLLHSTNLPIEQLEWVLPGTCMLFICSYAPLRMKRHMRYCFLIFMTSYVWCCYNLLRSQTVNLFCYVASCTTMNQSVVLSCCFLTILPRLG